MLYSLFRPALFSLEPEDAHGFTLAALDAAQALGLLKRLPRAEGRPVRVMDIDFPNAVGLAAGLDKDGNLRIRRVISGPGEAYYNLAPGEIVLLELLEP